MPYKRAEVTVRLLGDGNAVTFSLEATPNLDNFGPALGKKIDEAWSRVMRASMPLKMAEAVDMSIELGNKLEACSAAHDEAMNDKAAAERMVDKLSNEVEALKVQVGQQLEGSETDPVPPPDTAEPPVEDTEPAEVAEPQQADATTGDAEPKRAKSATAKKTKKR